MEETMVVPAVKEVPSQLDSSLLTQLQAAFWKQKAMEMRVALLQNDLNKAYQEVEAAALTAQGLGKVVENKYEIELGKTHSLDIETGRIVKL